MVDVEYTSLEMDEKKLGLLLAVSLRAFSPETFHEIQAQCLAVCKRYGKVGEDTIPMPVVRADSGQWNDVDEPSLPEVMVLTVACLSFNLFPFFESGALEMLRMAFPLMAELTSGPEA